VNQISIDSAQPLSALFFSGIGDRTWETPLLNKKRKEGRQDSLV
jgi:hypothetical protein